MDNELDLNALVGAVDRTLLVAGVRRGEIVTQLESKGCSGDVRVFYFEGSRLARTVNCGI